MECYNEKLIFPPPSSVRRSPRLPSSVLRSSIPPIASQPYPNYRTVPSHAPPSPQREDQPTVHKFPHEPQTESVRPYISFIIAAGAGGTLTSPMLLAVRPNEILHDAYGSGAR